MRCARPALAIALAACTAATALAASQAADSARQPLARTVWDGVYSAEQAERGRKAYERSCGYCHRDNLEGGGEGPPLIGARFTLRWRNHSLADLFTTLQTTMPLDAPGTLSAETYADVMTFLLKSNGVPSGQTELPADVKTLADITYPARPKPPRE
jgi:mono/diheme cytochrome c family protein